jgi:hypothetical protein
MLCDGRLTDKHGGDAELKKHLDNLKAALKKQVPGFEEPELNVCHLPATKIKTVKVANRSRVWGLGFRVRV